MRDLTVTLIQAATVWHDPAANRRLYGDLIAQAAATPGDLVVLPETFLSGFSLAAAAAAEGMDGTGVEFLREQAARHQRVITGSLVVRDGDGVKNRLVWAEPDGSVRHYDKRHLFRMAGEHERYAPGRERLLVGLGDWRICPLVCYDLRFPVYSRNRPEGEGLEYDLVLYVANWPAARRLAWRTLLAARAIENLCYCVGVNRVGVDGNDIAYAGDSAVVDPLGQRLVELGPQPQWVTVTLSAEKLLTHRERFPAFRDADRFDLHL